MKRIWLPTLVTLCLGLVGCGGGDKPGSDDGPQPKDATPADKGNDPAGDAGGASSPDPGPLELKYVLPDYDVAVVAHPQRAWASKFAEGLERKDAFPQLFLDQYGVDLRTVERVLVLAKVPSPDAFDPTDTESPRKDPDSFNEKFDPGLDPGTEKFDGESSRFDVPEVDRLHPVSLQEGALVDESSDGGEVEKFEVADGEFVERPARNDLPVVVVWFSKPVDVETLLENARGLNTKNPREHNGVTYYQNEWAPEALAFPDPQTMYFASPTGLKRLIDAKEPQASPLADRLAGQSLDADVIVVADLADDREGVKAVAERGGFPPMAAPALQFAGQVDSVVARLDLSHSTLLDIVVEAVDGAAAAAMEAAAKQGAQGLLSIVQGLKGLADPEQGKLLGVAENVLEKLEFDRDGTTVRAAAPAPDDWSPVLAVLKEGIATAEKAATRAKRFNGLKKIGAALIDFHDIYGAFPAVAGFRDADGKPLLSWRVAILPMLGQGKLFDQFEKDEPWDSEHNLKLLEKMPEAFKTPGVEKRGMTSLLAVVGANTGLGDLAAPTDVKAGIQGNVRFRDIIDGSSGTVLVVEANADMAVPWTKPADATFDDATIATLLEKGDEDGLMVLLADGFVAFLDRTIPPELFRQMLIRNDGEFPEKWFEYRR